MKPFSLRSCALTLAAFGALLAGTACAQSPVHVFFQVQAGPQLQQPVDGRLLIFLKAGKGDKEFEVSEFHPGQVWVAAAELHHLTPGATVEFNADELAFPKAFRELPAGDYEVQALLDVNHSYVYSQRNPADWISPVLELSHWTPGQGAEPKLVLDHHAEPGNMQKAVEQLTSRATASGKAQRVDFESPLLSRFHGRPVQIHAWVILPPGYDPKGSQHYPTAYWTHGFGGGIDYALLQGMSIRKRMDDGKMPPMIWVMLDESIPEGTHEFADSINNGPWGAALTTEMIPYLESHFLMDATTNGRFLNGHSSGGWASLQLEVNYPQVFGGTWSTSPDPSDFHNFIGVDLYAPHANLYHAPDGHPWPLFRDHEKLIATYEEFARMEAVEGDYGGQMASFEWVFSPKGDNGAPMPLYDRVSGDVDPKVVAYWSEHYDLANIVEKHWNERKNLLKGRIHLLVGTADSFYLEQPAHLFEARLERLGAEPHFTYIPNRTHFDLYMVGDDRMGLFDQIATEMYAVARPGLEWKKPAETK